MASFVEYQLEPNPHNLQTVSASSAFFFLRSNGLPYMSGPLVVYHYDVLRDSMEYMLLTPSGNKYGPFNSAEALNGFVTTLKALKVT